MLRRSVVRSLAAASAVVAAPAIAQSTTEIVVEYSIPDLFKTLHEEIGRAFMKANPQYKVTFRAPQPGYEEITQSVLRAAITNTLPDVAYHGLNRQRVFVDRGLAQPLDGFIAADAQFKEFGHAPGLLDIGKVKGKQYGVGFSLSTPILYVNGDLAAKAGANPDALPADWDGVFELARRVKALGGNTQGFHFDWDITGNWMFQALVFSYGGTMLTEDERKVAFDGEAGRKAIATLSRMVKEGT
ncbi:MAG: extracellular solute-binding protein, partial [Rhodospirillales bacterium]|nr:extracellular solute-binding protein [Rhodospirillales bacterium]